LSDNVKKSSEKICAQKKAVEEKTATAFRGKIITI
jgi:hypothetical protein